MSADDKLLYPKKPFLLTLKGRITVHYMDGQTLEGEITAQDELNIWLMIDDAPHLIPRSQIRYIKGESGQQIEPETALHIPDEAESTPAETSPASLPEPEPPVEVAKFVSEAEMAPFDSDSGGTVIIFPETAQPLLEEKAAPPLPEIDTLGDTGMTAVLGREAVEMVPETIETKEHQGGSPTFEAAAGSTPASAAEVGVIPPPEDDETTFVLDQEDDGEVSAHLVCTIGPHAGEVLKLKHGITTLGRSTDNTFPLPKDKEASRRHALIVYEASKFVLQDQNSLNGTFVNDQLVKEPRPLEDGDIILIGVSTLKFQER